MKTFKIEIREFLSKIVEVEADTAIDAEVIVKGMYSRSEIVLDNNDYVTTEISEYE